MARPKRGQQSTTTTTTTNKRNNNKKVTKKVTVEDDDESDKTSKCSSSSSSSPTTKNNKKTQSPTRKRRMASLNAEAMLHIYTSTSANINTNNEINSKEATKRKSNDDKQSNAKRKAPVKKTTINNKSKVTNNNNNSNKNKRLKNDYDSEDNESDEDKSTLENDDDDDGESSYESLPKKKGKKLTKQINSTITTTGRPKREASARASAMIIQTNEIERARYQYQTLPLKTNSTLPIVNTSTTNANTTNTKKPKNTDTSIEENTKQQTNIVKQESQQQQQVQNDTKSTTSSSIEHIKIPSKKVEQIKVLNLTVDNLTEHNKLVASLGPYNSNTREYILKWIDACIIPDEKPFPNEILPIEIRTFNLPDYDKKSKESPKIVNQQQQIKIENEPQIIEILDPSPPPPPPPQSLPSITQCSHQPPIALPKSSSLSQHQNLIQNQTATLNNLAAVFNIPLGQAPSTNQAPTSFNHHPQIASFTRPPYIPLFNFTPTNWQQYAAAVVGAAATSQIPHQWPHHQTVLQAPPPVHVFQQPTVNVVVKPPNSHNNHKKSSFDELQITVGTTSSPTKILSPNCTSTTATTTANHHKYQIKIKTEKSPLELNKQKHNQQKNETKNHTSHQIKSNNKLIDNSEQKNEVSSTTEILPLAQCASHETLNSIQTEVATTTSSTTTTNNTIKIEDSNSTLSQEKTLAEQLNSSTKDISDDNENENKLMIDESSPTSQQIQQQQLNKEEENCQKKLDFDNELVTNNDTTNSISSFSYSLKLSTKQYREQVWKACGPTVEKLISINVLFFIIY